jgi:branched-chain amino acid transport system ATP-binding protein
VTLLEARNITKMFGGLVAVNDVTFCVDQSSIVSVIGPNGAGKTTFFNVLTGIYKPDKGDITFDGRGLQNLRPDQITARGIARTFQNIRLFNSMTVLENVLVGMHTQLHAQLFPIIARTRGTLREERQAREQAREFLAFVGLDEKRDDLAKNLPYGDQRRLEIARALAVNPKLILLDEPTAGMNPQETAAATQLIRRLRDDRGVTVVLIEHDMRVVMTISEQITVLDYGTKIAEGRPEEIRNNAYVIEAYLGKGAASADGGQPASAAGPNKTTAQAETVHGTESS